MIITVRIYLHGKVLGDRHFRRMKSAVNFCARIYGKRRAGYIAHIHHIDGA